MSAAPQITPGTGAQPSVASHAHDGLLGAAARLLILLLSRHLIPLSLLPKFISRSRPAVAAHHCCTACSRSRQTGQIFLVKISEILKSYFGYGIEDQNPQYELVSLQASIGRKSWSTIVGHFHKHIWIFSTHFSSKHVFNLFVPPNTSADVVKP